METIRNIETGQLNINDDFRFVVQVWDEHNDTITPGCSIPVTGIVNYCLITTTKGSKSVTTLEFSTDSNPTWITTEEKWYLNKDIMSQAVIKKIVENELEYVLVDKENDEENADKSNPSIVIGIGQYWEASRLYFKSISPSVDEVYAKHVFKMKKLYNKDKRTSIDFEYINLKKQRIGYRFKNVSSCIIGYDPCSERSDEGYYDQYMFNIGNNYIFGGNQGYYDIEYIDNNDGDENNNYCSHIVKKIIETSAGVHTLKYSTHYSGPWWNDPDQWNEDNEKYNEYYSNKNFVEYTPEDFEEDTGNEILSEDMD